MRKNVSFKKAEVALFLYVYERGALITINCRERKEIELNCDDDLPFYKITNA